MSALEGDWWGKAGEELPAPSDPMAVARVLLDDYRHDDAGTLLQWCGGWMRWESSRWLEIEQAELSSATYKRLEAATYLDTSTKTPKLKPWEAQPAQGRRRARRAQGSHPSARVGGLAELAGPQWPARSATCRVSRR